MMERLMLNLCSTSAQPLVLVDPFHNYWPTVDEAVRASVPASCPAPSVGQPLSLQDHGHCQLHGFRALCPYREHGAQSHLHTFGLKLANASNPRSPWSGVQDAGPTIGVFYFEARTTWGCQ